MSVRAHSRIRYSQEWGRLLQKSGFRHDPKGIKYFPRGHRSLASLSPSDEENQVVDPQPDSLNRLLELSRPEWKLIGLSAGTLGVSSSITLLFPFASGHVIDYTILQNGDGLSPLLLASGLFGLTTLAGGAIYARALWLARAGNRIVARLKQRLYSSTLQQDTSFLDQQSAGDLLSRLTADAQLVQAALTTQAVAGLRAAVMSLGSAGMLLYTSPILAAISCATLPPTFIMTRQIGKRLQKRQEVVQKLQGEAASLAEQALSYVSTVKQYVAEDFEATRYHNAIAQAHQEAVDTAHMQAQLEAGAHVAGNAAVLGVLGYGGTLVLDGSISAGDLTGFVMYSLLLAGNLSSLTSVYSDLVRSVAASNRVFAVLDRKPQIQSTHQNISFEEDPLERMDYSPIGPDLTMKRAVSIHIQGLNFRYPSRPDLEILKDFSLTVEPGEVVAIVGRSGSGKSTIAGLLTRLYEADSPIYVDGRPITDYDPSVLRRMIAVVSQDTVVFQGTIRENIQYGSWATVSDEDIDRAARLAHVLDFASDFPYGLDTLVGPRQLSGGQRQRIALARALAKNSPVIILDEATSALDASAEYKVQQAMNSICQKSGHTIISIAHRHSTIRHASRIAVVDDGRIVQTGPFDDLKSAPGPFRELMKTQLVEDPSAAYQ